MRPTSDISVTPNARAPLRNVSVEGLPERIANSNERGRHHRISGQIMDEVVVEELRQHLGTALAYVSGFEFRFEHIDSDGSFSAVRTRPAGPTGVAASRYRPGG